MPYDALLSASYPPFCAQPVTYTLGRGQEVYVTTARHTGEVVLTKASSAWDSSSGTFFFTAVSTRDSTKIITITISHFDCGGQ